jgi:hypothetical protein
MNAWFLAGRGRTPDSRHDYQCIIYKRRGKLLTLGKRRQPRQGWENRFALDISAMFFGSCQQFGPARWVVGRSFWPFIFGNGQVGNKQGR